MGSAGLRNKTNEQWPNLNVFHARHSFNNALEYNIILLNVFLFNIMNVLRAIGQFCRFEMEVQ